MKNFIGLLIVLNSFPAFSWIGQYVEVKGVVKSFDQKQVIMEDALKGRIIIPRDAVAKDYKLSTGRKTLVPVEVKKFSFIKTLPGPTERKLTMQARQAFADLQQKIGIAEE